MIIQKIMGHSRPLFFFFSIPSVDGEEIIRLSEFVYNSTYWSQGSYKKRNLFTKLFATVSLSLLLFWPVTSVTIYGEILPLRQQKLCLWRFLDGLFSLWQNFEPTWAYFCVIRQIFIIVNSQILKN